jgi:hypothetical protein
MFCVIFSSNFGFLLCFARFVICKFFFFPCFHLCYYSCLCIKLFLFIRFYSCLHTNVPSCGLLLLLTLAQGHSQLVINPYLSLFPCCYFALVVPCPSLLLTYCCSFVVVLHSSLFMLLLFVFLRYF